MKMLAAILACLLTATLLQAADKPDDKAARLEKVRVDLKSTDVEVRRQTLGSLNHSDLSDSLVKEILEMLKDSDGEVRSMAATAVGTRGELALPGVPALIAQLDVIGNKDFVTNGMDFSHKSFRPIEFPFGAVVRSARDSSSVAFFVPVARPGWAVPPVGSRR